MYHLLNMIFTLPQFPSHPCSPLSHKHKKPIEERKCDDLIKKFPGENVSHVPQCDLHYVLAHLKNEWRKREKTFIRKCSAEMSNIKHSHMWPSCSQTPMVHSDYNLIFFNLKWQKILDNKVFFREN